MVFGHAHIRSWGRLLALASSLLVSGFTLWAADPPTAPTPPAPQPVAPKKSKSELKVERAALAASAQATPASDVRRLQAWKDAQLIASLGPGRMEVMGAGDSMKPIYGENTILVINKIAFDDLKPGMNAAYTNSRSRQVVHQLIAKDALGWRIQGHNNPTADADRVTRHNLIGVVYASIVYGNEP